MSHQEIVWKNCIYNIILFVIYYIGAICWEIYFFIKNKIIHYYYKLLRAIAYINKYFYSFLGLDE